MPLLSLLRRRLMLILAVMGPGIISASAGNDAGGITTYTTVGASYGYQMLWMLVIIAFALAVVQEMCARMGAVTGKGLSDLIREQFGVRWTAFAMLVLLIANAMVTVSEFSGIAAAMELFGVSRYLAVPVAATMVWFIVTKGSYARAERVFIVLALFQWSYVVAGAIVRPDWLAVGRSVAMPTFNTDTGFVLLLIGAVGTTIAPWMQFYQQAAVVDKGLTAKDVGLARLDVLVGSVGAIAVVFFIVVTCGATIHASGLRVESVQDAAEALRPLAGTYCSGLFALGLLNASLFAASILPLATAYQISEGIGWERGVDRTFGEAREFYTIYTLLIVLGAGLVLIPNAPLLRIMYLSQVLNGMVLPIVLVFMLLLLRDPEIVGEHTNSRLANLASWTCVGIVSALVVYMSIQAALGR